MSLSVILLLGILINFGKLIVQLLYKKMLSFISFKLMM